jgi:MFS family permease
MIALAITMGVGRFAFTPILPLMQLDSGLSIPAGSWLAFANYAGTLAGALTAVAVPVPLAVAIRAGLLAIGLSTVGMALAHGFVAWLLLRALAGLAVGWVLPLVSAWALERLASHVPALRSAVFAGFGVGIAGAGVLCLGLMQASAHSSTAWLLLGLLSLLLTAILWRRFDEAAPGRAARRAASAPSTAGGGGRARVVVCYGAFGFGYIVPATFLPVMAREVVRDPAIFGWAWPLFGLAAAVSTVLAGTFVTALGTRRLWIVGHVVMALGVIAPVVWSGVGAIVLSALLVGATFTVITMAGFEEGRRLAGPHATRMIATMAVAFNIGQLAGPIGVRYALTTVGDFSRPLLAAALVLVLSAVALAPRS